MSRKPADPDWVSLTAAAAATGAHRITLGRWVAKGALKAREGRVGNLVTRLVRLSEVRELVGAGLKPGPVPGRPRKPKG